MLSKVSAEALKKYKIRPVKNGKKGKSEQASHKDDEKSHTSHSCGETREKAHGERGSTGKTDNRGVFQQTGGVGGCDENAEIAYGNYKILGKTRADKLP